MWLSDVVAQAIYPAQVLTYLSQSFALAHRNHKHLSTAAQTTTGAIKVLFSSCELAPSTIPNRSRLVPQPSSPCQEVFDDMGRPVFTLTPGLASLRCLGQTLNGGQCRNRTTESLALAFALVRSIVQTHPPPTIRRSMLSHVVSGFLCHRHNSPDHPSFQHLLDAWEGRLEVHFFREQLYRPRANTSDMRIKRSCSQSSSIFDLPEISDNYMIDKCREHIHSSNMQVTAQPSSSLDSAISQSDVKPLTVASKNQNTSSPLRRRILGNPQQLAKRKFRLYNERGKLETLHSVITSELKESNVLSGHIYVFWRPEEPEYLKIGFTTGTFSDRLADLRRSCRSPTYEILYATGHIPNARRVESLIHADLRPVRYIESRCKGSPKCSNQHREWFKASLDTAVKTVEYWAEWMTMLDPYEDGCLRAKFVRCMFENIDDIRDDACRRFLQDSAGFLWVEDPTDIKTTE